MQEIHGTGSLLDIFLACKKSKMRRPRFTVVQEEDGNKAGDMAGEEEEAGVKDRDEGTCGAKSVFNKVDCVTTLESSVPFSSFA